MWMTEWRAISARIEALLRAGEFFLRTNDNDNHGSAEVLIGNAGATEFHIRRFLNEHGAQLQNAPRACLSLFVEEWKARFGGADKNDPFGTPHGFSGATAVLTFLASFRADFEYLIADTEATVRSLVVRAFNHLQRSIVADDLVRERWRAAFEAGETSCEALGACHLLAHGIWAFKTSAAGERTDLVLGEQLDVTSEIEGASQGLVLTEWKRVRGPDEPKKMCRAAYEQARRYRAGILAGFEVASPRYLVIVSKGHIEMPIPIQEAEVTYEYRNIAVDPGTPSQDARVAGTRSGQERK
ncbi:MAG: hypothetical protein ACLQKA_09830 [Bryobacteraceae bacterium]